MFVSGTTVECHHMIKVGSNIIMATCFEIDKPLLILNSKALGTFERNTIDNLFD